MGAIAEAIAAYAQPLIDQSDGTIDGLNHAMAIAQVCWNLAILPEDQREEVINSLKPSLNMSDGEFAELRELAIAPMLRRHRAMFPEMHSHLMQIPKQSKIATPPAKKHPEAGRYDPCPCGSGRKYKFCCGERK